MLPGAEELRRSWGCDKATADPIAWFECPECDGQMPSCPTCRGDSKGVPLHRCPSKIVPPEALEVFELVRVFELGVLPAKGGLWDQAATFVDAITWALCEREKYRERAEQE